jgi:ATP-dependent RNA helicase DDX46/PRP5
MTEEEKQRLKREKLEAWKKQRQKEKLAEGKAPTPEPAVTAPADKKPVISTPISFGKCEFIFLLSW